MRTLIILVAVLLLSGCMRDDPTNMPFVSYEPRDIDDGLILSTPRDEGIDPEQLEEIFRSSYADENLWSLRSQLVIKNNTLVAEACLKDEGDITTRHLIWSCTKQVMGILSGIAADQGIISSDWIRDMLSVQEEIPDASYQFGYYWWLDTTRNIQFMWGHGGQFAFIVPDKQLIVVMSSIPNTQGDYQVQADEALPILDDIISACY